MPRDKTTRSRLVADIRARLHAELGNCCAVAEERGEECEGPLQIDHWAGRDWVPRKKGFYERWLKYEKEHAAGLLRLLCSHHNNVIRPKPKQQYEDDNTPF